MEKQKLSLPSIFKSDKVKLPIPSLILNGKIEKTVEEEKSIGVSIPEKFQQKYKKHIESYNEKFNDKLKKINDESSTPAKLWCDSCDEQFKNSFYYDKHMVKFKNCPVDECDYSGCEKPLFEHIDKFHSTGLYEKYKALNTPEELGKWKEERRKRYPTVENVKFRQQAQEANKKRGVISKRSSRFAPKSERDKINRGVKNEMKRKNNNQDQNRNRKECRNEVKNDKKASLNNKKENRDKSLQQKNLKKDNIPLKSEIKNDNKIEDSEEDENFSGSLPKFKGTLNIPDYIPIKPEVKKVEKNILSNLLGMYGSDSETNSDDDQSDMNDEVSDIINEDKDLSNEDENTESTNDKQESSKRKELGVSNNLIPPDVSEEKDESLNIEPNLVVNDYENEDDDDMPDEQPIFKSLNDCPDILIPPEVDKDDRNIIKKPVSDVLSNSSSKDNDTNKIFKENNTKEDVKMNKMKVKQIRSKIRKKGSLLDYSKLRTTPQNTLLEKLIEPEIRKERSILFQCVRYIVENNFFGIGQDKKQDETDIKKVDDVPGIEENKNLTNKTSLDKDKTSSKEEKPSETILDVSESDSTMLEGKTTSIGIGQDRKQVETVL